MRDRTKAELGALVGEAMIKGASREAVEIQMGKYWNEVIPVGAEAVQPDHGER